MRKTFFILFIAIFINLPLVVRAEVFVDSDRDGLSDRLEVEFYGTNPFDPDTDKDGYIDSLEIQNYFSPLHGNRTKLGDLDTDNDGLSDLWELKLGTSLVKANQNRSQTKEIVVDKENLMMRLIQDNIVLEEIPISSGRKGWETPSGDFAVKNKVDFKDYYGHANVPYNLEFTFNKGWKIYIHSTDWHDEFGKKNMSTGCVNVPLDKMKNIYAWADLGTLVTVY